VLFFALLAAFLGGSGIVHTAPAGTRFVLVLKVALTIALVGGAAAALAPSIPLLLYVAAGSGLALLVAPTLAGHALDRDQPRVLAPLRRPRAHDVCGGVARRAARLIYVLPRATDDAAAPRGGRARFSTAALVAVSVLALSAWAARSQSFRRLHQNLVERRTDAR